MAELDWFLPPSPPPPGSLAVGPLSWGQLLQAMEPSVQIFTGLDQVRLSALPGTGDTGNSVRDSGNHDSSPLIPHLVLLHPEILGAGGETRVRVQREGELSAATDLRILLRRNPTALPVQLYLELSTDDCLSLFRSGLFDALSCPLDSSSWDSLLNRFRIRLEWVQQSLNLRQQKQDTSRRLHAHRRQVHQEVAVLGEELIKAQHDLEKSNQELADHMAQLSLLYKFGRDLSTARNWDRTLESILASLASFVGADGSALVLRTAHGGPYRPRRTFQWEESSWDRVLLSLEDRLNRKVATGILAPGVYHFDSEQGDTTSLQGSAAARGIVALPLEHQSVRLGYLLLLDRGGPHKQKRPRQFLTFLQTVQVFLAEEVASAQMLDRLREIGSFNARVLESVRSFIWVVDELGRTVYCNRAARSAMSGQPETVDLNTHFGISIGRHRSSAEVAGRLSFDLLRDGNQAELFLDGLLSLESVDGNLLPKLMENREQQFSGNGHIARPDGEVIPVFLQTSIMAGRGEGESWLVVVAEDLRESKKLEAERIRADSLEGLVEMSATLAHEIRNPLMGLSAQAELLAEQLPADDKRGRYLEVITGEVERINNTINRLLNFVRPYEPERSEVHLLELAADCLSLSGHLAAEKEVTLVPHWEYDESDPQAWTQYLDATQIKQVILNLVLNAVEASPPGSEVRLSIFLHSLLELPDDRRGTSQYLPGICMEVLDFGTGISDQDINRIFQPFFTTKSTGTGLGLSISRKIVAAHGGDIQLERTEQHTVFRVLLPQRRARRETDLEQETTS